MSQVTHTKISVPRQAPSSRTVAAGGSLLALVAVAATFAFGGVWQDDATSVSLPAQPSLRPDGGPDEASVGAAATGSRPAATGSRPLQGLNEGRVPSSFSTR